MKTFFDASAFAKRYVEEPGSDDVEAACLATTDLGLCVVCVPEILSALHRRLRERALRRVDYELIKVRLLAISRRIVANSPRPARPACASKPYNPRDAPVPKPRPNPPSNPRPKVRSKPRPPAAEEASSAPRIIGGDLRGRRLEFTPDPRTRPMKDRVRETLFDLLGQRVKGAIALDLFAGSGALGFEALSRGASRAEFVERHFPTADALRRSAQALGVAERVGVRSGDVLLWAKKLPTAPAPLPADAPWVVFVSPPWEFFHSRAAELMALLAALERAAPPGSTFAVEADTSFDAALLPGAAAWDARPIPPAVLYVR